MKALPPGAALPGVILGEGGDTGVVMGTVGIGIALLVNKEVVLGAMGGAGGGNGGDDDDDAGGGAGAGADAMLVF